MIRPAEVFNRALRAIGIGDDVFISYARVDGSGYAAKLANELTRRRLACRFDQWAAEPGTSPPKELLRALRRSGLLVIVSTTGAGVSRAVKEEIEEFRSTRRQIIPIDLDGTIRQADWWPLISGLAISQDDGDASTPADHVLERIRHTIDFVLRRTRLSILAAVSVVVMAGLYVWAARISDDERVQRILLAAKAPERTPLQRVLLLRELRDTDAGSAGLMLAREAANGAIHVATLTGHAGEITSLAFSGNGDRLLTASTDGQVRLWPVDGRGPPTILAEGANLHFLSAAFSPDGSRILTVSKDAVRLWSHDGLGPPVVLTGHSEDVTSAAFSPEGTRVVSTSRDGTALVQRTDGSGGLVTLSGHSRAVLVAAWSVDGRFIATGSEDRTVHVWDAIRGGPRLAKLSGHSDYIASLEFDREGRLLVDFEMDGAQLWPSIEAQPLNLVEDDDFAFSAAFSPDGQHLAVGAKRLQLRSVEGRLVEELETLGRVDRVAWSPDSQRIVAVSAERAVIRDLQYGRNVPLSSHAKNITRVAFSPDGKRVATGAVDGTVHVSVASEGSDAIVLRKTGGCSLLPLLATDTSFSPDGRKVATAYRDGTVWLWPSGGREKPVVLGNVECGDALNTYPNEITSMAFSPDGNRLLATSGTTVTIWSINESGKPVVLNHSDSPGVPGGIVVGATFAARGDQILTALVDGRIWRWDLRTWRHTEEGQHSESGDVQRIEFSADNTSAGTAKESSVTTWPLSDFRAIRPLQHNSRVRRFAINRDGSQTVTVLDSGRVVLWRGSDSNRVLSERDGQDAAFSPDGSRVAATVGGSTRIWSVDDSRDFVTAVGGQHKLLAFSPDGSLIATTDAKDNSTKIWGVTWERLIHYLSSASTICLTVNERTDLLDETRRQAEKEYIACESQYGRTLQ